MNTGYSKLLAAICASTLILSPAPIRADDEPTTVAPGEDRSTLRWVCEVDGSLDEVWAAFTTKEGIESWMVPVAEIDLRVGGTLKTNYDKKAGIGGPGTIVHHILSFEPKRMITSRFDAPENAQVAKIAEKSWGITYFDEIGPVKTRITLVACGYGEGPEWDKARDFFQKGNAWTLDRLREKFKKSSANPDADNAKTANRSSGGAKPGPDALDMLATLVGEWKFEVRKEDGKVFRGHSIYEKGPDGRNLIARGLLGDETKMSPHGATQIYRDPASGDVRFLNLDENGGVAQGAVRVSSDKELTWEWDLTGRSGGVTRYLVKTKHISDDAFEFRLYLRAGEPPHKELVFVTYRRVK